MRHLNIKSRFLITLLGLLTLSISHVWGASTTVTYKQTSTSAASVSSGTAPTGSSVTFSNTYTTKEQLTKNNSMTYTLKGYAGYKITALSMSMHSNKSAGTGKFSLVAGTTTLAEIASNTGFNQSAWYGAWTQSYVTVTPTMTKTDYIIKTGEDVVLTISASANSLFCESITITCEESASKKTDVSLNANSHGKTDGSVKYTVGNATPDATPTWVTPKDNTGWILNGYYTAASGGIKIITASNTLVANTTYADANGKWKSEETTLTLHAQWGTTTCATPSNLGQNSVTATSATLTWGTVTGAASYTVYITGADSYDKTIDNITTNSVFLDDLSPNTEYMWTVTAIGDALKGYDDGESNDDGYFTTEAACISPVTINKSDATLPEGCSFELSKTSGCGDDEGESVEVTCSPATHYTVTAVNSTSGTPGAISNNKCTVSGIKESTTISVTFTEDTKYTITFADNLQHTASIPNTTDNKIVVYENEIFTFPTISDKTAATSGTCEQVHYHFMGWVLSTHEGTIAAGDIKTGTSAAVTDAATYYAVWAKEEL